MTERTVALAFGFQGRRCPSRASTAARRPRGTPPIHENTPPTYTVVSETEIEYTVPLAFGSHAASWWLASTCARLLRGWPRMYENAPPTYQPPSPSGTTA